ncbi:MAG: flagellar motor switch protein FliN [Leptospiraceae bacterium]|nr:flagellar motor switch protein FliN [Leptospiraceae bacterium]
MAEENSSLSQEEIDQLLGMTSDDASSGSAASDDLNLDSLLGDSGGDTGGGSPDGGLDPAALSALTDAIGDMPTPGPAPTRSSGSGGRSGGSNTDSNVDLLLDVLLTFTVELGRTQMYIKDVLMLGEGSIVELDKSVGDEVDILVNERLFGRGRLVVMGDYFGIQITQILDPLTRYRNL